VAQQREVIPSVLQPTGLWKGTEGGEPIVDELLDAQLADEADVQAYLKTLEEPKKLEEYTRKELLELPKDDWDALVGTDPRKWSKAVMSIAMLRRSKTK
jgi:hypothetical protein